MLARYRIIRGKRPPSDPLPIGIRQDIRWRTSHILRPSEDIVEDYLASPSDAAWRNFRGLYREILNQRFREDRTQFDRLAQQASDNDVFIGCNCPTKANPRVERCHTFLALEFMHKKYPALHVEFPQHVS